MGDISRCHLLRIPDLLEEIDIELASRRLYDFVKPVWAVLEPGTVFVPAWHIGAICEHLEAITSGQIRNLLITVPPRHMNSLAVSVIWPAWDDGEALMETFATPLCASHLPVERR